MRLVPTTLREVAVDNILIVEVGLRAAEFGVECWEKAKYTPWKSWHLAHAKAVAQYREYKLNSFLKHHGVEL